jgi:hypothetical protein
MKFAEFIFRDHVVDPTLPPGALENASQLINNLCCEHCNRCVMRGSSILESFGFALAHGWQFRFIGPDVILPSGQLVRLADLLDTGIIEVICPHCACEFE